MKIKRVFLLLLGCMVITGCDAKFQGTWCRYTEVYSSNVILKEDATDLEIKSISKYIGTIGNLKSFDIIDEIENTKTMIAIYYKNNEKISDVEEYISKLDGVEKVESKTFKTATEKLVINKTYTYGNNLDNVDALEESGSYEITDNQIILKENEKTFYYKDKYLCTDDSCSTILTKVKGKDC